MSRPLFVYGTLMERALVERLLRDAGMEIAFELSPARLDGWRRGRIRGASYPGITSDPAASTSGCLLSSQEGGALPSAALALFDEYEGDLYERVLVTARSERGPVAAFVYALRPQYLDVLEDEDWTAA